MTTLPYVYKVAEIVKVTDGLRLDVGLREQLLVDCRLDGWDAPEMNSGSDFEKQQARVARQVASDWLTAALAADALFVHTEKDPDDFGRWLGTLWTDTADGPVYLGQVLADQQLATAWPTRWREVYDTSPEGTPA